MPLLKLFLGLQVSTMMNFSPKEPHGFSFLKKLLFILLRPLNKAF